MPRLSKGTIAWSIGSNNLLNTFPTRVQAANRGNGYTVYNPYASYGFNGPLYYGRLAFSF